MIRGTLLSHQQVYQTSPNYSQTYEAVLSVYVGGGCEEMSNLAHISLYRQLASPPITGRSYRDNSGLRN